MSFVGEGFKEGDPLRRWVGLLLLGTVLMEERCEVRSDENAYRGQCLGC